MKKNTKKFIGIIIICVIITVLFSTGLDQQQPIEDLDAISGLGADLVIKNGEVEHIAPMSVYLFEHEGKIESILRTGIARTIGQVRQNRQLADDKQNLLGLEKVLIISEQQALYGLKDWIDILFRNPYSNDTEYVAVCKGKASDILGMNLKGYPSSADFIEGLIRNSVFYNFFSNNYKLMDLLSSVDSEGCNVALPYIEVLNNEIKITGMALFDKDKMVSKIGIDELRIMNIMRENNVNGILTIQKSPQTYVDYYAKSKRKVSCIKKGDKYKFIIDINLEGDLIQNTIYKDLENHPEKNEQFNKEMSEEITDKCNDFIIKMKNGCKVDCLQLGRVAAAKYGRQSGNDWNKIICNSEIKVNVNVKINKTGRRNY